MEEYLRKLYIATELDPDNLNNWIQFAKAFRNLKFEKFDPLLKRALVQCLEQPIGNEQDLALAGITLLKLTPGFTFSFGPHLNDSLLLALLKKVILPDPELETLLKKALKEKETAEYVPFFEALKEQCELNEYLYAPELERKEKLEWEVPQLTPIHSVSQAVQKQYEENPYPRWKGFSKIDYKQVPEALLEQNGKILIAGCGTGQHAFQTAALFPKREIIAIDLSKASLGYALQKQRELGFGNVHFYQGDILELGNWKERFDLIECVGVLHHLKKPLEGWKVLRNLLEPGGWMNIGLYSALGRQDIAAARRLIEEKGWKGTAKDIRKCRDFLLQLPSDHPAKSVTETLDFYTLSSCRDLLFHVEEHVFTLPTIAEMLSQLNLTFVQFDLRDPSILGMYHQMYPEDPPEGFLPHWDSFEKLFPKTFSGMYQFYAVDLPKD